MTALDPRPWPYLDIPRPPLGVGEELVSAPEAVGILGRQLHPGLWPDPPTSWREHWPALRGWFAGEQDEGDQEYRDRTGRAKPPDDDAQLCQLLRVLTGLLALGFVRAVDERGVSVPRTTWGTVAAHGNVLLGLDPDAREKVCRTSRAHVVTDQAKELFPETEELFAYLVVGDVEAVAGRQVEEVASKIVENARLPENEAVLKAATAVMAKGEKVSSRNVQAHMVRDGTLVVHPKEGKTPSWLEVFLPDGTSLGELERSHFRHLVKRVRDT